MSVQAVWVMRCKCDWPGCREHVEVEGRYQLDVLDHLRRLGWSYTRSKKRQLARCPDHARLVQEG